MIMIIIIGLSLSYAKYVAEYQVTACDLGYSVPSVLSLIWLTIQHTNKVFAINVPCNVAFPTVSATLQILSKLFPVHQLLLGWLKLIDNYKFVWSRI